MILAFNKAIPIFNEEWDEEFGHPLESQFLEMTGIDFVLSLLSEEEEAAAINSITKLAGRFRKFYYMHNETKTETILNIGVEFPMVFLPQTNSAVLFSENNEAYLKKEEI